MQNLEELFKEICLEEANHLNEFWENSTKRLAELESLLSDERTKEKQRQIRAFQICNDIDDVLANDGYNGYAAEVIDYFSRRYSNFYINNCYFEAQHKLRKLYNSLPKESDNLELFDGEYRNIIKKMNHFKHINEEILINSILKAFQYIIPEHEYDLDFRKTFYFPSSRQFLWTHEVQEEYIDYELVTWYKNNINDYLCTPICDLKFHKRARLFK